MNTENDIPQAPALSGLEMLLKQYFLEKISDPQEVMTTAAFGDYIQWMMDRYAQDTQPKISFHDIPDILNHPDILALGRLFTGRTSAGRNPLARKALLDLFDASAESAYFKDTQDITSGRFLRYIPAYWDRYDYFVIYYVISGTMPVMFTEETLQLTAGSVLFIPPGVRKASVCPADDVQVIFFMLRRSTFQEVFQAHLQTDNLMSAFFEKALSEENRLPYLLFQTGNDPVLQTLAQKIYQEYHLGGRYGPQIINSLMNIFFLLLLRGYEETAMISQKGSFHWNSTYAEILKYIETHYAMLSIDALSSHFGYSSRQMIRIIRSITGKSFSEIRTQLRMQQAARLLHAKSMTVAQISEETGYANPGSFCRAFRNYYGCTPGDYVHTLST